MAQGCTVILPTYNESENIEKMIRCLRNMYPDHKILVMDDNSKDGTKEIVEKIVSEDKNVRIVTRDASDRGLTASVAQGIAECGTEFFLNMDSDFQHPPSALGPMFGRLTDGADIVIGVRTDRGALPPVRWLASWAAHCMANFTLKMRGKQVSGDTMSGLFGGRTDVFAPIVTGSGGEFERRGFKILFDLLKFAPCDIVMKEIPFEFGKRQGGESKIGSKVIISVMRQCGRTGKFAASVFEHIKE